MVFFLPASKRAEVTEEKGSGCPFSSLISVQSLGPTKSNRDGGAGRAGRLARLEYVSAVRLSPRWIRDALFKTAEGVYVWVGGDCTFCVVVFEGGRGVSFGWGLCCAATCTVVGCLQQ